MEEFFSNEEIDQYISKVEEDDEFASENSIVDDYEELLEDSSEAEEYIVEDFSEAIIRNEGGKWYVYDDSGKKKLGGPYESKDQAMKRLRQVEFFKKAKADIDDIVTRYTDAGIDLHIAKMIEENPELSEAGDTYHNKLSPDSPHNKNHRKIPKKCRKCGSTKNIDLHHPSGDRKNLRDTKGIIPLCRKCHRKLHQGKGKSKGDIDLSQLKNVFSQLVDEFQEKVELEVFAFKKDPEEKADAHIEISEIEFIDEENVDENALAKANVKKQKDLMYVAFKLVHAGSNKNKDHFTEAELQAAEDTPRLKGLNWQHSNLNIGVIYDSKFVPASKKEPAHIVCAAAVWKYKFPDYAKEMRSRYTEDNLKFSMEVWFDEAECSTCRKIFPAKGNYCTCLTARYENSTDRILHGLNFGGAGVVSDPADEGADALAIASKNKETERSEDKMEELQQKLDAALAKIQELETKQGELKTQLSEANDKLAEVNTAKESLEAQAEEIQKTADEYKAQLDKIEADKQAEAKASERYEQLENLGVAIARDDEDFSDFYENLKTMSDEAFKAMVKAAEVLAKKMPKKDEEEEMKKKEKKSPFKKGAKAEDETEEEAEDETEGSADASVMPVGDADDQGKSSAKFPWLVKALGADMDDIQ